MLETVAVFALQQHAALHLQPSLVLTTSSSSLINTSVSNSRHELVGPHPRVFDLNLLEPPAKMRWTVMAIHEKTKRATVRALSGQSRLSGLGDAGANGGVLPVFVRMPRLA
eukprot:330178-Pleurochrysis_carterae.AAC.3